jgi:hypothetical protein
MSVTRLRARHGLVVLTGVFVHWQELVSVSLGDNKTGEMTVLGHVKHKLVCSPDFESLLDHKHR